MPNGLVLLDAETCRRLWVLVPPPDVYPMVVWDQMRISYTTLLYVLNSARDFDDSGRTIPAVDAVTALRMLEEAGLIVWGYAGGWWTARSRKATETLWDTYHAPRSTPEALLLAVLDAIDGGAK